MSMFSIMKQTGSEQLKFCVEKNSNFRAIIAINSTALGPALGDITFVPATSSYKESAACACLLAQKLTSVYAFLGLHYGGAKIIAQGMPEKGFEEVYFRSLARHVNKLNGRFIIKSSSYVNKSMLDHIRVETQNLLAKSVVINDEKVLPVIKRIAMINTIREVSTKIFDNREVKNLRIGFFGSVADYNKISWLLSDIPEIKVFNDPSKLTVEENNFDIILIYASAASATGFIDLLKTNFKAAVGVCEEEIDMEVYEDVMNAKNIFYVPGYLVENLEAYYFKHDHINQVTGVEEPNFKPFEMFVREKLACLFDESIKKKEKITKTLNDFAAKRIEMLQLLK